MALTLKNKNKKALVVLGTRPDAIKLAPVIRALRARPDRFTCRVCATAQHRELLDPVLRVFDLRPDYDLGVMRPDQGLAQLTARTLEALQGVLEAERPDLLIVQGDTTTTFVGALAAYYNRVPVAHVEAGLRSFDPYHPFPEELNRRLTDHLSRWHFAPTERARRNLLAEGFSEGTIAVTGNTGIDALYWVCDRIERGEALLCPEVRRILGRTEARADSARKLVLVTLHRRENLLAGTSVCYDYDYDYDDPLEDSTKESYGSPLERVCEALRRVARRGDVEIVYPVHLNPRVRGPVHRLLKGVEHVRLIEPLDYPSFVALMRRAYLILTDSGGLQEEAPALGIPTLVLRETTERPEALSVGATRLVGTTVEKIVEETQRLLEDSEAYRRMATAGSPYGDGHASERILERLARGYSP